jgi:hypothetical protein
MAEGAGVEKRLPQCIVDAVGASERSPRFQVYEKLIAWLIVTETAPPQRHVSLDLPLCIFSDKIEATPFLRMRLTKRRHHESEKLA